MAANPSTAFCASGRNKVTETEARSRDGGPRSHHGETDTLTPARKQSGPQSGTGEVSNGPSRGGKAARTTRAHLCRMLHGCLAHVHSVPVGRGARELTR